MAICEFCGKKTVIGRQQRHHRGVAGKRWKKRAQKTARTFKPNLQKVSVTVANKSQQLTLCTKCIKRFKQDKLLTSQQTHLSQI